MGRFDPYSRRQLRNRRRAWLRANRGVVGGLTVGLVALLVVEFVLLVVVGTPNAFTWWLLGVIQVGAVCAYAHLLHSTFLTYDGRAIRHVRGSLGEENTRSELGRAKRRRLVWDWVDSIDLQQGDLDHLVVTRRGGLLVIDSKWRTDVGNVEEMARSARRAATRAEGVVRTVAGRAPRTRHRGRGTALPVTPVVVLWGAGQQDLPQPTQVDGVAFVPGRQLVAWLRHLEGQSVSRPAARDLIRRLEDFRARAGDPGPFVAKNGTKKRIEWTSGRYRAFLPFFPTARRPKSHDPDRTGSPSTRPLPYIRT